MKYLSGLDWQSMWVSHLGCIKGCLNYLSNDVSDAWLFGATGYAFIMNIHPDLCPSGPTAYKHDRILELGRNIGFKTTSVTGQKNWKSFPLYQKEAWELARASIDEGYPCIGWELDIPEYYIMYGYDYKGYYYKGPLCPEGAGPRKWKTLADTEIGVLNVAEITPCPKADDRTTVKSALAFAVEFARTRAWLFEKYSSGIDAYDTWIATLENGIVDANGLAYNAQVWSECRSYSADFLAEARQRLPGECDQLFDKAIADYTAVADNLSRVAALFPFLGATPEQKSANTSNPEKIKTAIACLKSARDAEYSGLLTLEQIAEKL